MELRDYLRVLRKYWVLIVALALLGVAIAATYSLVKTPEYSSSAKVFVSTQSSDNVQELAQGNAFTQQRVKTYADLVSTPIVLLPVVGSLELNITAGELAQQRVAGVTRKFPVETVGTVNTEMIVGIFKIADIPVVVQFVACCRAVIPGTQRFVLVRIQCINPERRATCFGPKHRITSLEGQPDAVFGFVKMQV